MDKHHQWAMHEGDVQFTSLRLSQQPTKATSGCNCNGFVRVKSNALSIRIRSKGHFVHLEHPLVGHARLPAWSSYLFAAGGVEGQRVFMRFIV